MIVEVVGFGVVEVVGFGVVEVVVEVIVGVVEVVVEVIVGVVEVVRIVVVRIVINMFVCIGFFIPHLIFIISNKIFWELWEKFY